MVKQSESDKPARNKMITNRIVRGESMSKENVRQFDGKQNSIKLICVFPQGIKVPDNIKDEVKSILQSELQNQIRNPK